MPEYPYLEPDFGLPDKTTSKGEASRIEEYVPTAMPMASTRAKCLVASPPKKNIARAARMVVTEVLIERA